ncbi:MAG TPA: 30S ribosomal protein S15 [Bacteroidales bacterium]|nr:30S ribosomal protein S15 [Bacteroidales bacterium]HOH21913.1 30S ribosomal protein S15 [Bacteroidales bacterium]HPZ03164.1 30S ribosomal protein S15 [Bacteroidales bacterium]HQB74589.1 30S ribosomal protein S15 [Bacteroidales bacterium]HQQ21019.1 30S ribosomal protein S15 [Bacteroidales bacterium]
MYLTKEVKQEIFNEFGKTATDTGSPESQIALFTYRIKHLTEYVNKNKKDHVTKKALITLVGKRKRLLEYLKRNEIERYREVIKKLGLRK